MTLAVFAYAVMPALALAVAGIGYAVIWLTAPNRSSKSKAIGDRLDRSAS